MESLSVSTQTLEQFLVAPFYQQNNQFRACVDAFIKQHRLLYVTDAMKCIEILDIYYSIKGGAYANK